MPETQKKKKKLMTQTEAHKQAAGIVLDMLGRGMPIRSAASVPKSELEDAYHVCSREVHIKDSKKAKCCKCGTACYYIDESPAKKICIECARKLMEEDANDTNKSYA